MNFSLQATVRDRCVAAGGLATVRAGASLPEVVAAACACGVREGRGWVRRVAGGTRLVQGRLAVGFSLRWKVVLNHRAVLEGLLAE